MNDIDTNPLNLGVSKVGSWSFNFSKKLFFATFETYLVFGRSIDEFDGSLENVLEYIVKEDRDNFLKGMEGAYHGTPLNVKGRILTSKGDIKHIHIQAETFYHDDKTPDVMMGTVQDITDQLLLESKIMKMNRHFNPNYFRPISGEFKYNYLTKKFDIGEEVYNLLNLTKSSFDGSLESIFNVIHPEDQNQLSDVFNNKDIDSFDIIFRVVIDQDEVRYCHSVGELHIENGEIQWITGYIENITKFDFLEKETERKLMEIQRAQTSFLIGSWELDFSTMKFLWSEATYEIYGLDSAKGAPDFDAFINKIHPDDRKIIIDLLEHIPKTSPFEVEFRIIRREGDVRHIKHLVEVVFDKNGDPQTIRGNIQDITQQKEMEVKITSSLEALNHMRKRFNLMADNSQDVFEIVDGTGQIMYISPSVENMMGITSSEIEGRHIWDFVEGNEKNSLRMLFKQCVEQPKNTHIGTVQTTKKNGEVIFLEVTMNNQLSDSEINGIVLNWRDITKNVNLKNIVHRLANYDDLTGLPNRLFFKLTLAEHVDQCAKNDEKLAVFMVDIDEFKGINNVLSYEFGDNMIKKIGTAISAALSDKHVFLARFFGDQFGLIVDQIDGIAEGQEIAKRILEVFNESIVIEQYELFVTANIGFSIYPEDSLDSEVLVKYANIALSRAKDMGKHGYQAYSPLLDIKSFKDFSLRNDFKKAIENNELEVYFQPIVNLKTGQIIAGEALTRWNHPEWGMVPPTEFIPIAESTGLIIPMGKWLLDEVCNNYKTWTDKGLPKIKISVNYSVLQFYQVNFVKDIMDTINKYQLSPDFMILEITESVLINHNKQMEKDLAELKSHGIQIAIDDFGTGYSSLTYLSSMNIDVLKIDRGFVDDLSIKENSVKILIAIINLANDLNMKLVAEGVSEWDHLNFLRRYNCFAGQGYLFSKPLNYLDFEVVMAKGFIEPVNAQSDKVIPEDEQRRYERIILNTLLEADMTIVEINNKTVKVGQTKAQIKNIDLSGMSFITNIKFPVKNDIILQFGFHMNDIRVEVRGTIIWTEEIEPGKHLFGFEFIEAESNMAQVKKIISVLNEEEDKTDRISSIYEQIEKSKYMPKIPEEIYQILELLYDPSEIDIDVLAAKVDECEDLNKLLLENINSGYFKIAKKVFTIEEAIILLGMKTILNLIVFFITKLLFEYDSNRKNRKFDIYHYWRHVLGTSVAAQLISQKIKKGDKHMLFTYGLIHDVGIPVLDSCLPEYLDQIAEKVMSGTHQIVAEKIVLSGLTHSDIGAWLCRKWHFREDITEVVLNHHTPMLSETNSMDTMIMYVADVMSTENNERLLGLNSNYEVSEKVLELIGLTKKAYADIASNLSLDIDKVGTYFLL